MKVVAILLALLLTGCGGGDPVPPDPAELDRVEAQLAALPGVLSAELSYKDDVAVIGQDRARVDLHVKPGTDPAPFEDSAAKLLWDSAIRPIDLVAVDVYVGAGGRPTAEFSVLFDGNQGKELERRWGPRP